MVNLKAWLVIGYWWMHGYIERIPANNHLTTDPACKHHVAPKAGSRLDRASRGLECEPCMVRRAFGRGWVEGIGWVE
ncbi:hypothetical protein [Microbacterium sp. XT11]|uniref:hypothetical protein n=1 Tax=Microbacterium sp. XT11 TaxID=367477 RepID=UPI00082BAC8B|nr:hypothetical protein [Microbacterium sp. XT11]